MNILLVDDSNVTRILIKNILEEHPDAKSFKFFNAENGQVALDFLKYNKFEIAFIDWNMPVMDGEELISEIREIRAYDKMKLVVATAENAKENVIKMTKKKINGYLIKPFDRGAVMNTFTMLTMKT